MSSQHAPGGVLEGLAVLATYLEDDGRRRSFAQDANAALRDAGIPEGVIPARTIEVLGRCSEDQLAAFSDVGRSLVDEGMSVDVPGEFGRVFFF